MAELNPWQTLDALRRELDRVFDETGTRNEPFFRTAFLPGRAARRYPLTNLYEDKDAVYLEALAPGIDPDHPALQCRGQYPEYYRGETTCGWGRETGSVPSQRTSHGQVRATSSATRGSGREQSPCRL